MFSVITSPKYWKEIEQVVNSKGEQILFKLIDTDVNIHEALDNISRLLIKHLIIDITCVEKEEDLSQAIRNYRIRNDNTQIIILAPNYQPGNETLSSLVTMGVYDILAPESDQEEDLVVAPLLLEVLDNPIRYPKAVKWDIGAVHKLEENTFKTSVKVKYVEKIESVFKKVIAIYSPTSEGASSVAAHMAHSIAVSKKCKVLLIDFNPLKPMQREIFNMKFDFTLREVLDAAEKGSLNNIGLESFARESKYNKNLHVLCGLYNINDFYDSRKEYFEEIIERAKFAYDYVIIDTHSWYDISTTDRALYMADDVIVPVRGREHSLNTLLRYLESFDKYNDFDTRKFHILINRYGGDDLTSLEIISKVKYPIIGYITNYKEYDKGNGFRNDKLINEYIPILNKIGINASKKKTLFNIFKPKPKIQNTK